MKTLLTALLMVPAAGLADGAEPPFPLRGDQESVAAYARRTGLESTKTTDLGNDVKMEFVLIPAGKFILGSPMPTPTGEEHLYWNTVAAMAAQAALAAGIGVSLVVVLFVVLRTIRARSRPEPSRAQLTVFYIAAGLAVVGGLLWHEVSKELAGQKAESSAAAAWYRAANRSEAPAREVTISKPFYLGKSEVTVAQWQQVMFGEPRNKADRRPLTSLSWTEAREFCKRVSAKAGLVLRLPAETEWDHAYRADARVHGRSSTSPIALESEGCELQGLSGRIWEWCEDDWHENYNDAPGDGRAWVEEPRGDLRTFRGGSWSNVSPERYRGGNEPGVCNKYLGFRVVLEVPPQGP